MVIWGTGRRDLPTPWKATGTFTLFDAHILLNALACVIAGGIAVVLFFLMLKYTRLGIGMRAASTDQEAALSIGIPVGRVFGATWFIAGTYAALAGIFLAMFPNHANMELGYIALRAFPAVIVGGLESVAGAVIAGLLLGLTEILAQGYINDLLGDYGRNFHIVFPYIVMLLFLVFRPHGLFGRAEVKRG